MKNRKKIILINPPIIEEDLKGPIAPIVKHLYFNSLPLGLAYLSAYLMREGYEVSAIDAPVLGYSIKDVVDIARKSGARIAGITSTTCQFQGAVMLERALKEGIPDIKTILGGVHVSGSPISSMKESGFDYGVIGEGEETLLELVQLIEDGGSPEDVRGIVFRDGEEIRMTQRRPFIKNLDYLPFAARHLFPIRRYRPQPNDEHGLPKLSMQTSRGCPYHCLFCDKSTFGNLWRPFSPEYVAEEMEEIVKRHGAKDIALLDSTFTVSESRVMAVTSAIKRKGLHKKVTWTCAARANICTRPLLEELKSAGCWRVRIGVESGNESVLRFIRKEITREQVRDVVTWADEIGLQPKGFFMIGHLTDTEETIRETMEFALSLPFKDITIQINTPLPGTEQFDMYKDFGTLSAEEKSFYSFWQPVFIPRGLSKERLESLQSEFYRRFYLRPQTIRRHLREIKRLGDLRKYFRALGVAYHLFFGKAKGIGIGGLT